MLIGGWPCPRCGAICESYQYWGTGDYNIRWACGSSDDDNDHENLYVSDECKDREKANAG